MLTSPHAVGTSWRDGGINVCAMGRYGVRRTAFKSLFSKTAHQMLPWGSCCAFSTKLLRTGCCGSHLSLCIFPLVSPLLSGGLSAAAGLLPHPPDIVPWVTSSFQTVPLYSALWKAIKRAVFGETMSHLHLDGSSNARPCSLDPRGLADVLSQCLCQATVGSFPGTGLTLGYLYTLSSWRIFHFHNVGGFCVTVAPYLTRPDLRSSNKLSIHILFL